jgi:hypothetical protein
VKFWLAFTRNLLVTLIVCALAMFLSFLTIQPLAKHDSSGLGILWFLVFFAEAAFMVIFTLALTEELVKRKARHHKFRWSKALRRYLIALPIAAVSLCASIFVLPYMEGFRTAYWPLIEAALYCLFVVAAYFALSLERRVPRSIDGISPAEIAALMAESQH